MALELCSDNSSPGLSPRISFSHDLCLSDIAPVEQQHAFRPKSSGGSSIDFDFCVRKSFDQESSSADELFSDGKILPTEIKKKMPAAPVKRLADRPVTPPVDQCQNGGGNVEEDSLKRGSLKEMKSSSSGSDPEADHEAEEMKQSSKSFWRFKRSSSLNCGSGYGRSLCPLPLLSRSNSTGSTPSVKRAPLTKDHSYTHHNKQHKQAFLKSSSSQATSSSTTYQKPPLKKNYGSTYGNGVRVNPVLNVPSGNLFGLGSIFFNGKDKNKKK